MESRKQWMSFEERESYQRSNYWDKDGLSYNPRKFIRKREVERIINAVAYEMKGEIPDENTAKLFAKYIERVLRQKLIHLKLFISNLKEEKEN